MNQINSEIDSHVRNYGILLMDLKVIHSLMICCISICCRQHIPKQKQILIDFTAIDAMTGTNVKEVLKADQTSF